MFCNVKSKFLTLIGAQGMTISQTIKVINLFLVGNIRFIHSNFFGARN